MTFVKFKNKKTKLKYRKYFLLLDRFSRPSIGGRSRPGARTTTAPDATSVAAPDAEEGIVVAKEVKPVSTSFARGRRKYLFSETLF